MNKRWRKTLLVPARAPTIDASVEVGRRLDILLPKQLFHRLEATRLGIKQDLRVEVTKLVRRKAECPPVFGDWS